MVHEEEGSVYVPIPHYPPFKLRSSLIDKDPVIWVHLLEAYIKLFKYLNEPTANLKLNVKSQQQLQLFLKVFLAETAEETSKIFSLGAINPDIKTNTAILRTYVFLYIRNFSIVRSNLTGESVWNFIQVYVKNNATIVRGLVDGSYKSKFNDNKKSGSISSISSVQKWLETLIVQGKFADQDLVSLSYLLGQQISVKQTTVSLGGGPSVKNISKKPGASSSGFVENFVTVPWIEMLERLYANGKSVHEHTVRNVMIVSMLAMSVAKISKLAMELGIKDPVTMKLFPLFSTVILSDSYKKLVPNLEERLPFLRQIGVPEADEEGSEEVSEESIALLLDLIPGLTKGKATKVLQDHHGDVEGVTNMLLESPNMIEFIEEAQPVTSKAPKKTLKTTPNVRVSNTNKQTKSSGKRSVYDDDEISRLDFSKATVTYGKKNREKLKDVSEDMKQKTLTAALRLIYESDEDEPDNTYDDHEQTSGEAMEETKKKSGKSRIAVVDDEEETGEVKERRIPGVDDNERYLFSVFKTKGSDVFGKTARKSTDRQALKKATGWSDEQVEGWLRMLLKSPRRFKILEEAYFYSGNPNKPKKNEEKKEKQQEKKEKKGEVQQSDKSSNTPVSKNAAARKEKNKASRANHNRKSGHGKKTKGDLIGLQ